MSAARSGENNPNYGKTHSAETRAKMRAAQTGKTFSAETRAKLRAAKSGENNPFYGKKLSPESIAKRTATRKLRARMKRIVAPEASIYVC
jgi:plasmid stability protein